MAIQGDFGGTTEQSFQIAGDIRLKNSSGTLQVRTPADDAYSLVEAATPTAGDVSNKVATTAFVDTALGGLPGGGGGGDVVGPASSTANRAVTFADTTGKLIKEGTFLDVPDIATPAAPSAGNLRYFARSQAGRMLPAVIGPSGIDTNLQPALFRNTVYMWLPGSANVASIALGTNWVARNSGTGAIQAHPAKASTNALTSMNRATYSTGSTSTGQSGIQSANSVAWRGNASGLGGFFFFSRFAVETFRSDLQLFIGLSNRNTTLAGEPSDQPSWRSIGLCKDSGDTDWTILTQGVGSTKTPLTVPLAIAAGTILDFMMFAPPNGSDITFRLVNAVDGTVYSDNQVVSDTLPPTTTFMQAHAMIRSTTGTTPALLALNRIYVECDL